MITDTDKAYLLSLKPDDLTKEWFDKNCSIHFDTEQKKMVEPRFKFQDKFKLKPKEYVNTTEVETNVGQFLVNKFYMNPFQQSKKW